MAPAERDPGEGDAAGVAATSVSLCVYQNREHVKISSNDFVCIFIEQRFRTFQHMKLTVSGRAWVGYEGTVGHSRKRQLVKTKSTSRSPNSAAERKWQWCGNLRLRVLGTSRVDVGDRGIRGKPL